MITSDARCTREVQSRTVMAKAELNRKKTLFTSKLDLNLRKKLVKCYTCNIALFGAQVWTVDQNYQESVEMWCWRRMQVSWTDRVSNQEVLRRVM
jgi:hypothetical protein